MTGDAVDFEAFVDDIYEASVVAEHWPRVLDHLARIADAEGTLLFAVAPGESRWLSSAAIHDSMTAWAEGAWYLDNPRGARLVPRTDPRFLTDLDEFTLAELDNEPFYTRFLRPRGLGWVVGTAIRAPSGDTLVFSIEKAFDKGPVPREVAEQLDQFRPHLARASLLSARLGLERARSTVSALDMIGLPAVAIAPGGRALAANSGFLASAPGVSIGAFDQVQFLNPAAQAMFADAIAAHPSVPTHLGRSIPVASADTHPPFVAHVLPMRRSSLDVFTGAVSLLFLTPLTQQSSPGPDLLQALFDLTPAEARVASMVVDGRPLDQVAMNLNVSLNTVRTQLKSVFAKTGAQRQAELVSLLGRRWTGSPT
ncbi:MAG: helix-turn-helix transcriptional regulator [Rhizobiales bacterium]|nr:helix-turn-helix transcriptional regulator [Hyphomicrobiales bacterium]